ncbi:hypothetical protein D3C72_482310 [compost metagenome]
MLASIVTTRVNAAPAIIRQISLSDFGAGPFNTGFTVGNRYGDASSAIAATATENGSDAGISDNTPAMTAHTDSDAVSANGQFARCATCA